MSELKTKEKSKPAKRSAPKKAGKQAAKKDDAHTIESRDDLREELNRDVEEFLRAGGKIQEVDANVTADPPRKPTSNYGSRPI